LPLAGLPNKWYWTHGSARWGSEQDPSVDQASDMDESHLRGKLLKFKCPKSTKNGKKIIIYKWDITYIYI